MTAPTAFLLGLFVGQVLALAAVGYARHAVRAARCAAETDEGGTDAPSPPAERSAPHVDIADRSPIDTCLQIAQQADPSILMPVIRDGVFVGALDIDARGSAGRPTRSEALIDRPPPTPPAD